MHMTGWRRGEHGWGGNVRSIRMSVGYVAEEKNKILFNIISFYSVQIGDAIISPPTSTSSLFEGG
jgi:hypothetical protein